MGDILFLSHTIPFPAARGGEARGYHVLRQLAARKRVHLIAFASDPLDVKRKEALADVHANRSIVWRSPARLGAAARAFATGRPASLAATDNAQMRRAVERALRERAIDAVYILSAWMAQYLPAHVRARVVADLIEPESTRLRADAKVAPLLLRAPITREANAMFRHEQAVVRRADATLVVDESEAERFRAQRRDVRIGENGVDSAFYDPQAVFRRIEPLHMPILFAGQTDDRRGLAAAAWFAGTVMPHIRARYPEARFTIVERSPGPAVVALAAQYEGVMLIDGVIDLRPWIAAASVVVAPQGSRGGVLEAMAMARPVVAAADIAGAVDHGGTIQVGGSVGEIADEILWVLANGSAAAELGRAARERAMWRYHWPTCLAAIDAILSGRDS
ncbi:hypothetical protein BH09PSE4_BH09PSE4_19760 [soil metagenome]